MNFLIKPGFVVFVAVIVLNYFSPETTSTINKKISETTGIEKTVLDENLNSTTQSSAEIVKRSKEKITEDITKTVYSVKKLFRENYKKRQFDPESI